MFSLSSNLVKERAGFALIVFVERLNLEFAVAFKLVKSKGDILGLLGCFLEILSALGV